MKLYGKVFFLLVLLAVQLSALAQTYPYYKGFSAEVSGTAPTGWGGNEPVILGHGPDYTKALAADVSSTGNTDTAITPLIGPLTAQSTLIFYYRILDQYLYPYTPTTFGAGDSVNVQVSVNGGAYETAFAITDSNHSTNLQFTYKKVALGQWAGSAVNIRFLYRFGGNGGAYYVDIDTLLVKDEFTTAVPLVQDENNGMEVYPNPCSTSTMCIVNFEDAGEKLRVYDLSGREIYSSEIIKGSNLVTIPVESWPDGIYFLHAGSLTRKLIVAH
ncbi:MAG TPA: T9SS type A sorting domain-containing protein [Chitinophagales bacterium]|nr:T9SS type A sorting domain-containing protein [Chitinophagales bacterium]